MEEILKKLTEHFGFAAPFGYAVLAYGFFYWLDENASDEAKAALARTMSLKDYKSEQVASALVEVFDRIYTFPLLSYQAFFRSLVFTAVVTAIYVFEVHLTPYIEKGWWFSPGFWVGSLFNVPTDYLSLFVIRSLLFRSGTKAVTSLALAALSGTAIVMLANVLRVVVLMTLVFVRNGEWPEALPYYHALQFLLGMHFLPIGTLFMWPAVVVFIWLPLFALGILVIRALIPLSWIVAKVQWALKEGDQHPLRAIGCVAAVVVFLGTVGGRAVFNAL
jgi:hypothetical protein